MSDELEAIRQKKFEALQAQYQAQADEQRQVVEKIRQLESLVRQKLDNKALQRYGNLKTAHPEKAVQALVVLAQMNKEKITDEQLKEVLFMLEPPKRHTKIVRK